MVIHKKFTVSVVSLACALVMWQTMKNTCPPREQHLAAVTDVVERAVDRIFEERIQFPEESKELADYLSSTVIPQAVEKLTAQRIDFTSYGIFSMGNVVGDSGDKTPISIGAFGKVMTVSEDDVYEFLKDLIGDTNNENILQTLNNKNHGTENIETDESQ